MRKRRWIAGIAAAALLAGACSDDSDDTEASGDTGEEEAADDPGRPDSEFFSRRRWTPSWPCATSSPRARPTRRGSRPSSPTWVDTAAVRPAGRRMEGVLLQRGGRQPVAAGRLDDDAGRGRAAPRDRRVRGPRRRGLGRQADLGHRVVDRPGLRRADRLAQHDGHADAGRRGGVRDGHPGHRVRPWRQHRLPGDVHQADRRLRLRGRRRRVPGRRGRARAARCWRCASCPASTCWRPGSPGPSRSSRRTASTWSAPSSPRATRPTPSRS